MQSRYLNDAKFHDLVSWMRKFIHEKFFTLQDLRDAVDFIAAQQNVQADPPLLCITCAMADAVPNRKHCQKCLDAGR
jgi:hypothetical protein